MQLIQIKRSNMNNKIIITVLIIAAIMLIMEASLLLSALFLFAKNEKESNNISKKNEIIENNKKISINKENKEEIRIWNIEFPTLNIKGSIKEGWDNDIINNSIGHMNSNKKIDELVVLKSIINEENKYFEKIDELKIGDQIIYQYNDKINKYIIVENKIVANEKERIKQANNEQIMLLTNVKDLPKVSRCVIGQIIN